ncbi:MAG TPA: hypothetical protein VFV52_16030 [Bacilli bacterium]|nr:hypothetical protein [Bacilli bacterium]
MSETGNETVRETDLDSMTDYELLLLSWAQMVAIEMIAPDEEAEAAKSDLVATLMEFGITDVKLKQRDLTHYEISYRQSNEEKSIRFENDEVESIYDL